MNMRILIAVIAVCFFAACNDNKPAGTGLAAFDACSCATVQDMNSADFAKCKELRADAKFEADYQKCKIAATSGIKDTSKINLQSVENATNLKPAETGSYAITPGTSTVTWYGEKITGKKHTGTVAIKSGNIDITDGKLTGEIILDMSTITDLDLSGEGKTKLETHLKSDDFFGVAKFPEAKFVIKSSKSMNAIQHEVVGNLTIKGITKEVSCKLVVGPNGSDVNIGGGLQFDRSQFDVRYGSDKFFDNLGDDLIKNEITIVLDLKGKRAVA
jgi:polyisoprenoid-binding protein YceI